MTDSEYNFKLDCHGMLLLGVIPTPKRLYTKGHGNGRNLNGEQCRWRVEAMERFGCRRVGVGPAARWLVP